MKPHTLLIALMLAACSRPHAPPPSPANGVQTAPRLNGARVVLFPVQQGRVPVADATLHHWGADAAALDAELAYWLQQNKADATWMLPAAIDRIVARSPGLNVDPHNLAVGLFQRARVERIGDPLFGDMRKVAAFSDAQLAVIPVSAEYVGATAQAARLEIATAIIKMDADVLWFGVIAGNEGAVGSQETIASAAQAFANALAPRKTAGENR